MDKPFKQVAALPWRRRKGRIEVLLITTRQSQVWIIPKGWPMDGLSDPHSAQQEAFEESGVEGRIGARCLGNYGYAKGSRARFRVKVFPLRVKRQLTRWPEQNERKRRWLTLAEAIRRPRHRELAELLAGLSPRDLIEA